MNKMQFTEFSPSPGSTCAKVIRREFAENLISTRRKILCALETFVMMLHRSSLWAVKNEAI